MSKKEIINLLDDCLKMGKMITESGPLHDTLEENMELIISRELHFIMGLTREIELYKLSRSKYEEYDSLFSSFEETKNLGDYTIKERIKSIKIDLITLIKEKFTNLINQIKNIPLKIKTLPQKILSNIDWYKFCFNNNSTYFEKIISIFLLIFSVIVIATGISYFIFASFNIYLHAYVLVFVVLFIPYMIIKASYTIITK